MAFFAYHMNHLKSACMKFNLLILCAALLFCSADSFAQSKTVSIEPVNFSKVKITDDFWRPKMDKVATTTLAACIYQTEVKTARIRNFEKVARRQNEKHEGIFYDDSDVFKALEAMAYSLKNKPDAQLQAKGSEWIDKIAAAQLPDGYLNTFYTLGEFDKRWTDMSMHEDYNAGHMIEAGIAWFDATGERKLLDVCIRWADYFDSLFGPGKRHWVTGHQELELALVKLYRVTSNEKYLKLADWLLSERGKGLAVGYTWTDWKDTAYAQDVVPVKEQKEITGHAVRAMYLYTGAADVAAHTGDAGYLKAMRNVWEDVVFRNMYITGGIGSAGSNEGFSQDFDLPNEQAYCETCASVGMVFWNQRMNSLTGSSEYVDILEKSLYNAALDGLSLTGDRFFYGNPLASSGRHYRREWFGTACCPANIARLVASLGNYVYATDKTNVWVNLYIGSETNVPSGKNNLGIKMETQYPWNGDVKISVTPSAKQVQSKLYLRIPGWAGNIASPGELYSYTNKLETPVVIKVNGVATTFKTENGYAVIDKAWKKGDVVEMNIPMPVRMIESRGELKFNNNRVALQRGPLIYCVEGADNDGKAWNLIVPANSTFNTVKSTVLSENIIALQGQLPVVNVSGDGTSLQTSTKTITAIPYYSWCNRGSNQMQVWLPTKISDIKINY
jgi:DUF1680 family protein